MMSKRYGVSVVGTGYYARRHSAALSEHPGAELVSVCAGRTLSKAEELKRDFGFDHVTSEYEAILADERVDIVFIVTPDALHPTMTTAALAAGKHVFCEKALARTETDFRTIGETLTGSGKTLQVGMNLRFRQPYSSYKDVARGLGEMNYLRGTYIYNSVHATKARLKPWAFETPEGTHSLLHGGAIHILDLLRWFGGDVRRCFASARSTELGAEYGLDTFHVHLEFGSGAMGELLAAFAAFRPNEVGVELWLQRGSVVGANVYSRAGDELEEQSEQIVEPQSKVDLALQFDDMLAAIERETPPTNSYLEAYRNFRLITAIEASLSSRAPADVGLADLPSQARGG